MSGWKLLLACAGIVLCWVAVDVGKHAPAPMPAGWADLVEPRQGPSSGRERVLAGWTLRPLASYRAAGRVLGIRRYWWSDVHALAPFDLVLGWGAMAGEAAFAGVRVEQEGRWVFTRWETPPPAGAETLMANIHIIPADEWVWREIGSLRRGDCVLLEGSLVEAVGADGQRWRSSMSRDDVGAGACEVLLVESLARHR